MPVADAQKYAIVLINRLDSSCDTVNKGRPGSVGTWQRSRIETCRTVFVAFSLPGPQVINTLCGCLEKAGP